MKQIIPFKKELLFQTKVSEITSISLEHTLSLKNDDLISGEFYITGDYKMTEGSINREKFSFNLPFEIATDSKYDISSMVIDIDNFYYEIINNESLQVNIDVYVEGEEKEVYELKQEVEEIGFPDLTDFITKEEVKDESDFLERNISLDVEKEKTSIIEEDVIKEELDRNIEYPKIDNLIFSDDKKLNNSEKVSVMENTFDKKNLEFNLFENVDTADTYVTYHVYIVKESDTIESVLKRYEITKDDLSLYNNIEEIKPGMKLIIPN